MRETRVRTSSARWLGIATKRSGRYLSLIALTVGCIAQVCAAQDDQTNSSHASSDAGRLAYVENCASCHGTNLSGTMGPALNTAAFVSKWAALPKVALATHISSNMPPAAPGNLDPAAYAAIVDFVDAQSSLATARSQRTKTSQDRESVTEDTAQPLNNRDAIYTAARNRLTALIQRSGRLPRSV